MIATLVVIAYVIGWVCAVPSIYRALVRHFHDKTASDRLATAGLALGGALAWPALAAAALVVALVAVDDDESAHRS